MVLFRESFMMGWILPSSAFPKLELHAMISIISGP
jgi:hypothetical protein